MSYRALISDTITLLKDQFEGQALIVTPETRAFFRPKPAAKQPAPPPALPKPPTPLPPQKKETPQPLPPKQEKKEEPPVAARAPIHIEPIKTGSAKAGMDDLRSLLTRIAPEFHLHANTLDDEQAKLIAHAWEVTSQVKPVVLLSLDDSPASLQFLEALSNAIHTRLIPSVVIPAKQLEKEKKWEALFQAKQLQWILSPPLSPTEWPLCIKHYTKNPTTNEERLGGIPLIMLESPSAYAHNPALKADLWKRLCQLLQK
jgi:hypothetical protein